MLSHITMDKLHDDTQHGDIIDETALDDPREFHVQCIVGQRRGACGTEYHVKYTVSVVSLLDEYRPHGSHQAKTHC